MKSKKNTFKKLEELSNEIPARKYQVTDSVEKVYGHALIKQGYTEKIGGKAINPNEVYARKLPKEIEAGHYRSLKRAYVKNGIDGVWHYLNKYIIAEKKDSTKQFIYRFLSE